MSGSRLAGAIAGGLVAGLGISALLLRGERKSGEPSELAQIERAASTKLGRKTPPPRQVPDTCEQVVIQGGHLLLSAAAGAVYASTTHGDGGLVPNGVVFGLAFYGTMHWVMGPVAGLKPPEWQSDRATIVMHLINHVGFGLATAAGAALTTARRRSPA